MLRPLAERMRPGTLDEVVGQTHLRERERRFAPHSNSIARIR